MTKMFDNTLTVEQVRNLKKAIVEKSNTKSESENQEVK